LSFPSELPKEIEPDYLGDIIICAPIVEAEAVAQNKSVRAHWAHMLVHGVLHLKGYDHLLTEAAEEMESLEIRILADIGFPNPYEDRV
jgi:probable rRNA maturation factor